MILMGRRQNNEEAIFEISNFETENEEVMQMIMEADSAVIGGMIHATLYSYRVALMRK